MTHNTWESKQVKRKKYWKIFRLEQYWNRTRMSKVPFWSYDLRKCNGIPSSVLPLLLKYCKKVLRHTWPTRLSSGREEVSVCMEGKVSMSTKSLSVEPYPWLPCNKKCTRWSKNIWQNTKYFTRVINYTRNISLHLPKCFPKTRP